MTCFLWKINESRLCSRVNDWNSSVVASPEVSESSKDHYQDFSARVTAAVWEVGWGCVRIKRGNWRKYKDLSGIRVKYGCSMALFRQAFSLSGMWGDRVKGNLWVTIFLLHFFPWGVWTHSQHRLQWSKFCGFPLSLILLLWVLILIKPSVWGLTLKFPDIILQIPNILGWGEYCLSFLWLSPSSGPAFQTIRSKELGYLSICIFYP